MLDDAGNYWEIYAISYLLAKNHFVNTMFLLKMATALCVNEEIPMLLLYFGQKTFGLHNNLANYVLGWMLADAV